MISDKEVKSILINQLKFKAEKLEKLEHYVKMYYYLTRNVILYQKIPKKIFGTGTFSIPHKLLDLLRKKSVRI